jgi:diguanylate cyclase (GGDEF)-like protein
MSHQAQHDFLTGLPNRLLLTDRLTQAIALRRRHGNKVVLLFLDLDFFKRVNDSLGHLIGDKLLQSVARRLTACVRTSDTVCRLGGDEFVVLLSEIEHLDAAARSAEKLLSAVAVPHIIGGHEVHVTLSMGISVCPDDGQDAEAMLKNADTAMYHAKKMGRNNYQLFTQDMNVRALQSDETERR